MSEVLKDETERDIAGHGRGRSKRCFASKDYIEGRTAFMEKRKPVFTGHRRSSSCNVPMPPSAKRL